MRPIVTDQAAWSVGLSVGLSVTIVSPAKFAELIDMLFGMWTRVGDPRNHVSDGSAHWRNLANTIEPSMSGGDAALGQITLTTCYYIIIVVVIIIIMSSDTQRVAWWRNGFGVGLAIKRSRVRLPVRARLSNDSGQVVHTYVPLSPSSIIWYRCKSLEGSGRLWRWCALPFITLGA